MTRCTSKHKARALEWNQPLCWNTKYQTNEPVRVKEFECSRRRYPRFVTLVTNWRIMKQLVTNWRRKLTSCLHWDELSYDPFTVIRGSISNLNLGWKVAQVDKKVKEITIYWDHKVPICCQEIWAGAFSLDRRTFRRRTQRIRGSVSECCFHTLWTSTVSGIFSIIHWINKRNNLALHNKTFGSWRGKSNWLYK